MLEPKLTIVVTCTDRKSLRVPDGARVRSLPDGLDLPQRHKIWRERLRLSGETRALTRLYAGEAWSRTPHLLAAARSAGFDPSLWVASAGLGLVPATCEAPAYSATFAAGQADSVGATLLESARWWTHFAGAGGRTVSEVAGRGSTLLVLSRAYAGVLGRDLHGLGSGGAEDVMLVGGRDAVEGLQRLEPDLGLRSTLGGTASSLNVRMAEAWLWGLSRPVLTDPNRRHAWDGWAARERRLDVPKRAPATDETVVGFIRQARVARPGIGYSTALRLFRAAGLACEQRRFASLFASTGQT